MLNIRFLGKLKIEYNNKSLDDKLGTKAYALICLLILNQHKYLSRERIIGYLWPDSNYEAARYNLRYNLWYIKKSIPLDKDRQTFLIIDKECCAINKDYSFTSDISEIINFIPSKVDSIDDLLKLRELFQGDFLEGRYFNNCDELNELIIFERINLEQQKVKILKQLMGLYEADSKYELCIETLNEILEIEPYDENIALKMIDLYILTGKRTAAISYYNKFSNQLAGNLGIVPSHKLKQKYNELRFNVNEPKDEIKIHSKVEKTNSSIQNNYLTDLEIFTDCMKGVSFFWMSSVIKEIMVSIDHYDLRRLMEIEVINLRAIQVEIPMFSGTQNLTSLYPNNVRDINIINAFIRLLEIVCNKHYLRIHINGFDLIDEISENVVSYLEKRKIHGLKLIKEK